MRRCRFRDNASFVDAADINDIYYYENDDKEPNRINLYYMNSKNEECMVFFSKTYFEETFFDLNKERKDKLKKIETPKNLN